MKCNPLRWLWGLLPLTALWWIGLLGLQQRVEDDLAQRSKEHLERNGLAWASVAFKGRDAMITGRAEEESDQRRPATEVVKVWGVRSFEDRIEVLQLVRNYVWTASQSDGGLSLTGYVPNEAARKAILASARSAFPRHKVNDKMELARGAPEQKQWLGGTAFAMRQLATLKSGSKAGLEAAGLVIEGEADTSRSYEAVRSALTKLPPGIALKTERVRPPLVKPYTWAAALRGRQIELTGHAPSVSARDEIKAAASRALPGGTVVDRMSLASGAPGDWHKAAASALARLGQLKQGNAEMRDSQLSVTGLTETEQTADTVRRSLKSEIPSSFRLIEDVRQDPAVKAAEEARRRAAEEAEARRVAEEARRVAELQRQQSDVQSQARAAVEAARRKAEEDARRATDEAGKRAAAEGDARRKAEADRARAETAAKARTAEGQRCQAALTTAVEAGTINFQRASAELDRRSHQTLDALAQIVRGCPGFKIEIGGHTDNEGEPGRNQRLSERRARSVLDFLVKVGVPSAALDSVGYGETQPKVSNDSPANMARNRRIELRVKAN